jgi:hypothetical protein
VGNESLAPVRPGVVYDLSVEAYPTHYRLLCLIAWLLYAAVGVVERKLHARFGG